MHQFINESDPLPEERIVLCTRHEVSLAEAENNQCLLGDKYHFLGDRALNFVEIQRE
jgi:hypothetical protein